MCTKLCFAEQTLNCIIYRKSFYDYMYIYMSQLLSETTHACRPVFELLQLYIVIYKLYINIFH